MEQGPIYFTTFAGTELILIPGLPCCCL